MQHELNHTVQQLLGARGLDEVSRETLSALVREYPYSALLHLLYSKKLQLAQDPRYGESVARTALYFSNPHWLHHLLRPKTSREAVQEMEQAFAEHVQDTPLEHAGQALVEETPAVSQPEAAEVQEDSVVVPYADEDKENQAEPAFTEPMVTEPVHSEQHTEAPESVTGLDLPPSVEAPESVTALTTPPSIEEQVGHEVPVGEAGTPHAEWQAPDIRPLEAAPEMPAFGLPPVDIADADKPTGLAEEPLMQEAPAATGSPAMPSGPAVPPESGLIPLEPYYTIDYFASQGIQLSEEEKQDPLARKLKRFTEWLKTMKKIHPDKSRPVTAEDHTEETVRQVAEHSNDRAEVVTEAMAEVYLKQGQTGKAVEIYRKLSLLDPSRSATFAAKIAELNTPDA